MKRLMTAGIFFLGLIAIWEILFRAKVWSPVLLPSPKMVGLYFVHAIQDGTLFLALSVTLRRLVIGYAIGLALGFPLAL